MNKRIYIPAYVRGSEFKEDQNEFDFVITTDKEDNYGTIFTGDDWEFERYNENPVVFYQHRSGDDDPDNLIGVTVKGPYRETLADGSVAHIARVRLEPESVNPKAEKIRKKIIAGTLRMASIGADVSEYRWGDFDKGENPDVLYFTRKELLEWSIVNIGSNAAAQLRSSNKKIIDEIRAGKPGSENNDGGDGHEIEARIASAQLELARAKR